MSYPARFVPASGSELTQPRHQAVHGTPCGGLITNEPSASRHGGGQRRQETHDRSGEPALDGVHGVVQNPWSTHEYSSGGRHREPCPESLETSHHELTVPTTKHAVEHAVTVARGGEQQSAIGLGLRPGNDDASRELVRSPRDGPRRLCRHSGGRFLEFGRSQLRAAAFFCIFSAVLRAFFSALAMRLRALRLILS